MRRPEGLVACSNVVRSATGAASGRRSKMISTPVRRIEGIPDHNGYPGRSSRAVGLSDTMAMKPWCQVTSWLTAAMAHCTTSNTVS